MALAESARQSRHQKGCRGKSGLHRARCQVTPGRREPTESATESKPPNGPSGRVARVKWCGKSAPRAWQQAGTANPTGSKRSEEHTSELQSLMRISYAVFCLKKKNNKAKKTHKLKKTKSQTAHTTQAK